MIVFYISHKIKYYYYYYFLNGSLTNVLRAPYYEAIKSCFNAFLT